MMEGGPPQICTVKIHKIQGKLNFCSAKIRVLCECEPCFNERVFYLSEPSFQAAFSCKSCVDTHGNKVVKQQKNLLVKPE